MHPFLFLVAATVASLSTSPAQAEEPEVGEVREMALRHAGLWGRLDRWSGRARWRNFLPEVTATAATLEQLDDAVRFDEYLGRDGSGLPIYDAARNHTETGSRGRVEYSIRLTFDLRGLLFEPAELPASREARERHAARRDLIETVHAAYFTRRLVLAELAAAAPSCRSELRAQLVELDARLDGLTGGWFHDRLETP